LFALFRREWKYISSFFKQTHINFAFGMLLFTLFAGTIIFYIVENGSNPSIHSFWDAMWFTVTTMVAGNSNISPVTYNGEAISVLMMLIGVSFVGVLTASLASWLMSKSKKTEDEREERIKNIETSILDIRDDIRDLKDLLKK
jgi:voltage-gated potassium channel